MISYLLTHCRQHNGRSIRRLVVQASPGTYTRAHIRTHPAPLRASSAIIPYA